MILSMFLNFFKISNMTLFRSFSLFVCHLVDSLLHRDMEHAGFYSGDMDGDILSCAPLKQYQMRIIKECGSDSALIVLPPGSGKVMVGSHWL